MDPTLNLDRVHDQDHPLQVLRPVRAWRASHSWRLRATALLATLAAFLATLLTVTGPVHARVNIEFDPMRPGVAPAVGADARAAPGTETPSAPAPGVPTLRITRMNAPGTEGAGVFSALVDDTWVRKGDVVAGYRVTALRLESIDLVNLAEPSLRLTLRLNPVSVERSEWAQVPEKAPGGPKVTRPPAAANGPLRGPAEAVAPPTPAGATHALPSWAPLALEKKP